MYFKILLLLIKVAIDDDLKPPVKSWMNVSDFIPRRSTCFGLKNYNGYENQLPFIPVCLWPSCCSWTLLSHFPGWRHSRRQCRWSPVWRSRSSWPPSPPTCTASTCVWRSTTLRRRRESREGSTSTGVGRGWEILWQTLPEKDQTRQRLRLKMKEKKNC